MTSPKMNLDDARRFLETLSLNLSGTSRFTFQTFADDPEKKKNGLARVLHGTFAECEQELIKLNKLGAGVFVTVNETDLKGRRERNVRRVRALFVDSDEGDLPDFAIEPNIIVDSAAGQHAYWLMQSGSVTLDEFHLLQTALSKRFGTDPKIKDLPRVMRIPGFLHQKKDPTILVKLSKHDSYPLHTTEELIEGLGLSLEEDDSQPIPTAPPPKLLTDLAAEKYKRCEAYMKSVDPAIEGSGGDIHTYRVAMIGADFDLSDAEFWPIFVEWNTRCEPPWNEMELRRKLENSHKYRKKPYGWRLAERREDDDRFSKLPSSPPKEGPLPPDPPWWDSVGSGPPQDDAADDAYWHFVEQHSNEMIGGANSPPPMLPEYADGDGDGPPPPPPSGGNGEGGGKKRKRKKKGRKGEDLGVNTFSPQHGKAPPEGTPPNVMAEQFIRKYRIMQDISKAVYLYNNKYWMEVTIEFLCGMAMQFDHFAFTKKSRRRETVDYGLAKNQISEIVWNDLEEFEIPFQDGILNILSGEHRHHRWEDFLDKVLPYPYEPDSSAPLWKQCLEDWFPGEDDKKDALQEFFGYILLTGTAAYKKALFLYGESDTGKSVVANVAREIVGMRNVCQIRLEDMDDPKKRAPIKGKMLNLISELPQWGTLAESGFKMLVSTGEPIEIEKKYINSMTVVPTCKHLIATNSLPWINDSTQATFNRLLILKFDHVVPKNKMDRLLLERLKSEITGIINWSIEGAKRLVESGGQFTVVKSSENIIEEYKETSNPIMMFVEHSGMVREDENSRITTGKFVELYNKFKGGRPLSFRRSLKLIKDSGFKVTDKMHGHKWIVGIRETTGDEKSEQMGQVRMFVDGPTVKKTTSDDFDF